MHSHERLLVIIIIIIIIIIIVTIIIVIITQLVWQCKSVECEINEIAIAGSHVMLAESNNV